MPCNMTCPRRHRGCPTVSGGILTLRVQVPSNPILTQNLYYNYYYAKPKCLIIGYLDPLCYTTFFDMFSVFAGDLASLAADCA